MNIEQAKKVASRLRRGKSHAPRHQKKYRYRRQSLGDLMLIAFENRRQRILSPWPAIRFWLIAAVLFALIVSSLIPPR